jgi:tryptophan synthase alpha chain
MPYFTLGFPDYASSLDIICACAHAGADLIELGIPFSDPLADGPTIQHSSQIALEKGMNVARCLAGVRELRKRGLTLPLMMMGYYNPALAYGIESFVRESADAGASGFIIPDLPPEEAGLFEALCKDHGMALSFLIAPNSERERIKLVGEKSTGFTYLVSIMGITGARAVLPSDLADFIARVRRDISTPLAVGFGISTAEQARAVGEIADGVIVGSALIKKVIAAQEARQDPAQAAAEFVRELHAGIDLLNGSK